MSNDKATAKQNPAPLAKYEAPADFVEIELDLPAFKAELFTQRRMGTEIEDYTGQPVQGVVLECRDFGEAKDPKTGQLLTDEDGVVRHTRALIVELEKPLMVQGRDKTQPAFEAQPGSKIVFFPTFKILQAILAVAGPRGQAAIASAHLSMDEKVDLICNHPEKMLRMWVMPKTRTKHPTDDLKRIWNYEIRVSPKLVQRTGAQSIGTQLWDTVNALPQAAAVNGARREHVLPGASQ